MSRSLNISVLRILSILLLSQNAKAQISIPFAPSTMVIGDSSPSTTGLIISSSTDPSATSYTTVIENISCPFIASDIFAPTITVTNYTIYTTTTCPCLPPSTMITLTQSPTNDASQPTSTSNNNGGDNGGSPSGTIPYADPNDFAPYYPCVPGSFLCTDTNTFWTCDITVSWSWTWQYPRQVATGMQCLPSLSPGVGAGQMPGAPAGYYRNDQYGRARPLGGCEPDGSIECLSGGTQWAICDHGGWTNMGPVAPGTICINGEFIAT